MGNVIVLIILVVFGILQIILFFKIWAMTNNVARIKDDVDIMSSHAKQLRAKKARENETNIAVESHPEWAIGSVVVRRETEEQMKIVSLNSNGSFLCTIGGKVAGSFYKDDLMTWNAWLEHLKK